MAAFLAMSPAMFASLTVRLTAVNFVFFEFFLQALWVHRSVHI